MASDWLTLSEVAQQLGVHPSTIRNWADRKVLPVHRTQGGHRRFRRSELDLWLRARESNSSKESGRVVRSALAYTTKIRFNESQLEKQDWYRKLNSQARDEYRKSGRKLMQGLSSSLSTEKTAAKAEGRSVGYQYAVLGRRHGLSSVEAVRAYLFFRAALQEAMLSSYEAAAVNSPQAWGALTRSVASFTDEVLLSLLETYRSLESA